MDRGSKAQSPLASGTALRPLGWQVQTQTAAVGRALCPVPDPSSLFQLKMILIKCCDISNEVRPMEVAEPWVDCLLEEYFMQV